MIASIVSHVRFPFPFPLLLWRLWLPLPSAIEAVSDSSAFVHSVATSPEHNGPTVLLFPSSHILSSLSSSSPFVDEMVVNNDDDGRPRSFDPRLLTKHWGFKPLLIRNAFAASELREHGIWPSWHDIVELACTDHHDEEEEDDSYYETLSSGESARLIQHVPGQLDSFTVEMGPFDPESPLMQSISSEGTNEEEEEEEEGNERNTKTNNNKHRKWTLLVNDVDRYYDPGLAYWMDTTFAFLPRWRRDDAQVSIAHTGGGIGPHVDNYDVFLIQASGKRTWRVGGGGGAAAALGTKTTISVQQSPSKLSVQDEMTWMIPNLSVRILDLGRNHSCSGDNDNTIPCATVWDDYFSTWHLNEGDVLYLPPRVVHWGIADSSDCMTLSVGCRAPSASELMAQIAEELATSVSPTATARLQDFDRVQEYCRQQEEQAQDDNTNARPGNSSSSSSITKQDKVQIKTLVLNAVEALLEDEDKLDELVGKLVTEPKRSWDTAFLQPYADIDDPEYLDLWGPNASVALRRVRCATAQGGLVLLRAPGISFATTQIQANSKNNETATAAPQLVHRLYAHGQRWQVSHPISTPPSLGTRTTQQVFQRIEKGRPITKRDLDGASQELLDVLEDLMAEGFLYAASTDQEMRE